MVGLFVGIVPVLLFVALWHFVQNIYVLMIAYLAMSLTTTDYFAKLKGDDGFRVAGMIIFPLISSYVAPFSYAYKIFLFGQLAFLLGKPDYSEVANASALRRQYGTLFTAIGFAGVTVGIILGIYDIAK